jgi:hypothetical protein
MTAVIAGTARVTCPACDRVHTARLVQSINTRAQPDAKAMLLSGELNMLECPCGARSQLAATLLYVDPDADYMCQVVPGGEEEMERAAARFEAAGVTGTRRVVPSQNALVEKVKILDAGLLDWAIEMTKVALLATLESAEALNAVMLFDRSEDGVIHWVQFEHGAAVPVASPLAGYERFAAREASRPQPREVRIDRAWAVKAVQTLVQSIN